MGCGCTKSADAHIPSADDPTAPLDSILSSVNESEASSLLSSSLLRSNAQDAELRRAEQKGRR
jgi:hypothetical protein